MPIPVISSYYVPHYDDPGYNDLLIFKARDLKEHSLIKKTTQHWNQLSLSKVINTKQNFMLGSLGIV